MLLRKSEKKNGHQNYSFSLLVIFGVQSLNQDSLSLSGCYALVKLKCKTCLCMIRKNRKWNFFIKNLKNVFRKIMLKIVMLKVLRTLKLRK